MDLQDRICKALESADGDARFRRDEFPREGGGVSRPRVLEDGKFIEKASERSGVDVERLRHLFGRIDHIRTRRREMTAEELLALNGEIEYFYQNTER